MFSCCALWATQPDEPDNTEHLKALDDGHPKEGEISITMDGEGMTDGAPDESAGTPLPSSGSPRAAGLQITDVGALHVMADASRSLEGERAIVASESNVLAHEATRAAEAKAEAAEETRSAAQADAEAASAERAEQAMRALREAEDAAHAAAAEAEKRRFEEEASARAARQAESEARKALWRAEEAQRMKETARMEHAEQTALVLRVAEEEEELARREAAAAEMRKAKEDLVSKLLSDGGVRLQKHGRNGKSTFRTLKSPDGECHTVTWGKTLYDLRLMQEVRKGTDADPASPGNKGTSELRRSKAASAALERSFSLLFPSRSLDFTVSSMEECDQLVLGFRALQTDTKK